MTNPPPEQHLSADKRELLDLMLAEEGHLFNVFPLSFGQQRLWLLYQLDPASPLYTIASAVSMAGALDAAALERSLNLIVERHESLRTYFRVVGEQPVQVILDELRIPLRRIDLRAAPDRVAAAISDEARRPFDLEQGPLLRATLVQSGDDEHVLVLAMHHIVSDGWSTGVVIRELSAAYGTLAAGADPADALPELPIQYADYAAWQRDYLSGETLGELLAYWQERLAGCATVLELPTDRPRQAIQGTAGARLPLTIDAELAGALRRLGQHEGATLFMTLLAAFQSLLYRYTNQRDIVVGSPIANRSEGETQDLIGFFVNTLVLRASLRGDMPFREALRQARQVCAGAYAHQDMPFDQLVDAVQTGRDLSRSPLFQVMFALDNMPPAELELAGLRLRGEEIDTGTAKFDLTLGLAESAGGLSGVVEYSTDLFDEATIARLIGHYQTLLRAIAADPDLPIGDLPLLTAAEQARFRDWNATRSYPEGAALHELVEAQAARTPAATAAICAGAALSYAELERRANQLAHLLRDLGIGAGQSMVGVCMDRTLEALVATIAILKAGGVFVPLDPDYPAARLEYMIRDAGVRIMIAGQTTLAVINELAASKGQPIAQVVCLDGAERPADLPAAIGWYGADQLERQPAAPCPPRGQLAEPIYMMYTSGSTGQPKGVPIHHLNAVPFFLWSQEFLAFRPDDRIIQYHTLSFDLSTWEIFASLLAGAALHIVSAATARDVGALADYIAAEQITVLVMTPSQFTVLADYVEHFSLGTLDSLRILVLGGEMLPSALARRALRILPAGCRVFNEYGPTETTISCAICEITPEVLERYGDQPSMPFGHPNGNTQLFILDERMRRVPVGVPGELYIGGIQLADSYYRRPDLTAERYVPHPDGQPGERLYKTGDLTRYHADGRIEFLGRLDHQVKVRGYRIELGEIEAALNQLPDVLESAVAVREDAPGDKRLVGYAVAAAGRAIDPAQLRMALKQRLPEYMVPSAIIEIATLPLSPNGKVDRRALPAPGPGVRDAAALVAPRTPAEDVIAAIWEAVLHVAPIGVEDNFFELGGHSLLATQVVARLRMAFPGEIPLRAIFEAPTIAELALRIAAARPEREAMPPLAPLPAGAEAPLSYAQQRFWFINRYAPESPVHNLAAALRLRGRLDPAALEHALGDLTARHSILRTRYPADAGAPRQIVAPPAPFALGRAAISDAAAITAALEHEAQRPFDLAGGPPLRALLIDSGADEAILALTIHHIAFDGWSIHLLIRELAALYGARIAGADADLPALPIQYADYAAWQRDWLAEGGAALERQLGYWRGALADAPTVLELPTDRPRPRSLSFSAGLVDARIPAALAEPLQALGRREGTTLFMTLLAGFQALLGRWSGQRDLLVGTPVANRPQPALEGLIGCFVNTLALRARLDDGLSGRALLAQVRATCLAAFAHQELPFETLVEALRPERDPGRAPLVQALFVLQNTPAAAIELAGASAELLPLAQVSAEHDLTLTVEADGDGLLARWEYNADLFDQATIERLAGGYLRLLEGLAARPTAAIRDLPLTDAAERASLIADAQAPRRAVTALAPELILAQAARTPDALALAAGAERISYRDLAARATGLAGRIAAAGAGAEQLVGVYLERSVEAAVALLAVLLSGAAYMPLDPDLPPERIGLMLEDARPAALIARRDQAADLRFAGQILAVDAPAITADAVKLPAIHPRQLAYVIFTSGSTGRPKAVAVEHQSLANHVAAVAADYGLTERDRVLQFAPLGFDVAIEELLTAWASGAAVVLRPADLLAPGPELHRFIERHSLTVLNLPASYWHEWALDLAERGAAPPEPLRLVIAGNERIRPELLEAWQAQSRPGLGWINAYGTTETTITALLRAGDGPAGASHVPVGRPIANTAAYLLDGRRQPVAPGMPGELCIGGDGLARGYHGRPDLTAERFTPDPWSDRPGARLYHTGDLARAGTGGIAILGRLDQQVKVRGVRVELGEVEAYVQRHPLVGQAVVAARADSGGNTRLVAYVVPRGAGWGAADDAELRQDLARQLPEALRPAAIVAIAAIPLTAAGKIDASALPDVAWTAGGSAAGALAPDEEVIAGIWREVLGVAALDRTADFFALGGHSLLAARMVARVAALFGREVPLRAIFDAPRLADFAASARGGAPVEAIPVASHAGPLPLSFSQQRLWIIDQLYPGLAAYNMFAAVSLRGDLDLGALERSLAAICSRHAVLRTTYAIAEGAPAQRIEQAPAPLRRTSLAALPPAARAAEVDRLGLAAASHGFDLGAEAPIRLELLELSGDDHVLLVTLHHIAADGWSIAILLDELGRLYRAEHSGADADLPALPIQYADYAIWQRRRAAATFDGMLDYWRGALAGAPLILDLPTDHRRPPTITFRGATIGRPLPAALAHDLAALGRSEGTTLFMTLLAGFQALLGRWSGQRDLLVGTPVANRPQPALEGLIGCFVNTLALRARLDDGLSGRALLAQVRATCLAAFAHQELPFETLVEALRPGHDPSHSPLVQVMFSMQNTPQGRVELPGIRLDMLPLEHPSAKYDLTLTVEPGDAGIQTSWEYNTDLFDRATIERLAALYERLLAGLAADPDSSYLDWPLLDQGERAAALRRWNATERDIPARRTVQELFEEQARLRPAAPAVTYGERTLSYRDLNERANALAHGLIARGVAPGALVGLCVDRSPDMIAGMLAILKAGAAYLPLDPDYPAERLAFMLADAGATLTLAQADLAERLGGSSAILRLDAIGAPPAGLADPPRQPAGLAYVIYTSGSTGQPKGIAIPHRSIIRLVRNTDYIEYGPDLRIAQVSNASFDAATFEIWGALLNGGHLIGFDREDVLDLPGLAARFRRQGVTSAFLTTTLFNRLVAADPAGFAGMRDLLVGGEAVDPAAMRAVTRSGRPARLLNMYGPTETTTFALWHPVEAVADDAASVPIGRPISNTSAYVLDSRLEPLPDGVPGELYLGGPGLAWGYLGRAALTAERFVPDPFAAEPGSRLYRTGDLVRATAQGAIEYLGRADEQVKVRGFRIEPGEIEAALLRHPAVRLCAALVREDIPGDKRIVAYAALDRPESVGSLLAFLGQRLPEYMLPNAIVILEALPLTPNGKLDRTALAAPEAAPGDERPSLEAAYVAPRTPQEAQIAAIWGEILGIADVGVHDDFFALGGRSLSATQLVSRVRDAFAVNLPLRDFFEAPTVEGLARRIAGASQAEPINDDELEEGVL